MFLEVFTSFEKSSANTVSNITSATFFLSLTTGTPSKHMSYQYFSNYLWWICSPFIYNPLQTNSVIKYIKDFVAKSVAINICKYSIFLYLSCQGPVWDAVSESYFEMHHVRFFSLVSYVCYALFFFFGLSSFYSLCFNLLCFTNILSFPNLLFYQV